VQGGAVRATSQEIVRTLKDLADRWGALVIAEGVETAEQLAVVRAMGIGTGQGYLLGRPSPTRQVQPIDLVSLAAAADPAIESPFERALGEHAEQAEVAGAVRS
jgi:EAL domain-containing protein (putative c-di-GMP-specific phosphodiesterase class I)